MGSFKRENNTKYGQNKRIKFYEKFPTFNMNIKKKHFL